MYEIFVAQYDRWNLEGSTSDRESARTTVRVLRATGKTVMVKRDGKKVNWRMSERS